MEQGADQFLAFVFGLFGVAFGGERLAAAEAVQVVREDHLVTGFFQQATGFVVQRHLLLIARRRPHDARDAGRQVHHARALVRSRVGLKRMAFSGCGMALVHCGT